MRTATSLSLRISLVAAGTPPLNWLKPHEHTLEKVEENVFGSMVVTDVKCTGCDYVGKTYSEVKPCNHNYIHGDTSRAARRGNIFATELSCSKCDFRGFGYRDLDTGIHTVEEN